MVTYPFLLNSLILQQSINYIILPYFPAPPEALLFLLGRTSPYDKSKEIVRQVQKCMAVKHSSTAFVVNATLLLGRVTLVVMTSLSLATSGDHEPSGCHTPQRDAGPSGTGYGHSVYCSQQTVYSPRGKHFP